ncbi:MAG: efflux RND transporter periplasmic adaptor subunit [Chitinophagaceae bacterium]|nr:efflux RND transporter periplasmic adaptor subunit [Chitinophagaceae bacterium]
MKTIGLEYGPIEKKDLSTTVKVNGILNVPNQNKATITSLFRGTIRSLNIQPGNKVRKDEVLAVIVNPELVQLQQQYLSVNTKINLAEIEFNRQKILVEGNAGARKNLQLAETELKNLQAEKAGLQKQLTTLGISPDNINTGNIISSLPVRSPIDGTVSKVVAQIGTFVDAGTSIAEVVNNSRLHLDLFVYEKDLPEVKEGQTIHFTLTNNPGKEYDATIYSIGTSFEDESKAIVAHAMVKGDKSGLIDGMNVTAVISIGTNLADAIPDEAIVSNMGKDYIFVYAGEKEDEISFKRIGVIKGPSDLGYTEVKSLEKIPAETKVVVKGAYFLLAKMINTGEEE